MRDATNLESFWTDSGHVPPPPPEYTSGTAQVWFDWQLLIGATTSICCEQATSATLAFEVLGRA
ncbi:conserved hypothetical protein [Streptomyces sviceus ATCC 29083]|uniref:Uncharacterized protein n=1 Tax=Streptomyces sviceus (strain ATCC 29083 / DSM 924 / JCM 4929 / NBRC 13980 / NCIMB 11184 / NRRL 5439 / UC 5370) TaxID=463191 RepID=B5HVM3_STRX2|nr:conserved hypothetical protein [Streptomyces sviceus ATCC 29083]